MKSLGLDPAPICECFHAETRLEVGKCIASHLETNLFSECSTVEEGTFWEGHRLRKQSKTSEVYLVLDRCVLRRGDTSLSVEPGSFLFLNQPVELVKDKTDVRYLYFGAILISDFFHYKGLGGFGEQEAKYVLLMLRIRGLPYFRSHYFYKSNPGDNLVDYLYEMEDLGVDTQETEDVLAAFLLYLSLSFGLRVASDTLRGRLQEMGYEDDLCLLKVALLVDVDISPLEELTGYRSLANPCVMEYFSQRVELTPKQREQLQSLNPEAF